MSHDLWAVKLDLNVGLFNPQAPARAPHQPPASHVGSGHTRRGLHTPPLALKASTGTPGYTLMFTGLSPPLLSTESSQSQSRGQFFFQLLLKGLSVTPAPHTDFKAVI